MRKVLFLLFLASVLIAAIPSPSYPDAGCSVQAGTVQADPLVPASITIADIVVKNDQPNLAVAQNLCTGVSLYVIFDSASIQKLAGAQKTEDLRFDLDLYFRDLKGGFASTKPITFTDIGVHALADASPYKTYRGKAFSYGFYRSVFAVPMDLKKFGIDLGHSYKMVALVRKKGEKTPLACRYWYPSPGSENTKLGVFKIVDNDVLYLIKSLASNPASAPASADLKKAQAAYQSLDKLRHDASATPALLEKAAGAFADAYIALLRYELDHGQSMSFLDAHQKELAVHNVNDPTFRAYLVDQYKTSLIAPTPSAPGVPDKRTRLLELLKDYESVLQNALAIREVYVYGLSHELNEGYFSSFRHTVTESLTLTYQADRLMAAMAGQDYTSASPAKRVTNPRSDQDYLFNILGENYQEELDHWRAVHLLRVMVENNRFKADDFPTKEEIAKYDFTRFYNTFTDYKVQALKDPKDPAKFFFKPPQELKGERIHIDPLGFSIPAIAVDYTTTAYFGTGQSPWAYIQDDLSTPSGAKPHILRTLFLAAADPAASPVSKLDGTGLRTLSFATDDVAVLKAHLDEYELRTIGKPDPLNLRCGTDQKQPCRAGGYLKTVQGSFGLAVEAAKNQKNAEVTSTALFGFNTGVWEGRARFAGTLVDPLIFLPLGKLAGIVIKATAGTVAKALPLALKSLNAELQLTKMGLSAANKVYRGATIVAKTGSETTTYVVKEVTTNQAGETVVRLTKEGTKDVVEMTALQAEDLIAKSVEHQGVKLLPQAAQYVANNVVCAGCLAPVTRTALTEITVSALTSKVSQLVAKGTTAVGDSRLVKAIRDLTSKAVTRASNAVSACTGACGRAANTLGDNILQAWQTSADAFNQLLNNFGKARRLAYVGPEGDVYVVQRAVSTGVGAGKGATTTIETLTRSVKAGEFTREAWRAYVEQNLIGRIVEFTQGPYRGIRAYITGGGAGTGQLAVDFIGSSGDGIKGTVVHLTGNAQLEGAQHAIKLIPREASFTLESRVATTAAEKDALLEASAKGDAPAFDALVKKLKVQKSLIGGKAPGFFMYTFFQGLRMAGLGLLAQDTERQLSADVPNRQRFGFTDVKQYDAQVNSICSGGQLVVNPPAKPRDKPPAGSASPAPQSSPRTSPQDPGAGTQTGTLKVTFSHAGLLAAARQKASGVQDLSLVVSSVTYSGKSYAVVADGSEQGPCRLSSPQSITVNDFPAVSALPNTIDLHMSAAALMGVSCSVSTQVSKDGDAVNLNAVSITGGRTAALQWNDFGPSSAPASQIAGFAFQFG